MRRAGAALDWLASPRVLRVLRVLGGVLVVAAIVSNGVAIRVALHTQAQQNEDRRLAQDFSCAVASAVVDAGIATIKAGGTLPPEFERNLRKLGYPSAEERKVGQELAAAAYARSIATRVQASTGRTDLVRPDGSLDCKRLRQVTRP